MKIAEALIERSALRQRIPELTSRVEVNVEVEEGESPAEDPQELLRELEGVFDRLEYLVKRINLTNSQVQLSSGETLTEAIARRDSLSRRMRGYESIADSASGRRGLYGMRRRSTEEVKMVKLINTADYRKEGDKLAAERRRLDSEIQRINWTEDLRED